MYVKMSKKGQITIPKLIRQKLNIENEGGVLFLLENDEVKLKGVPASNADLLAGSLREYVAEYIPLKKIRPSIQKEIAEKADKEGIDEC